MSRYELGLSEIDVCYLTNMSSETEIFKTKLIKKIHRRHLSLLKRDKKVTVIGYTGYKK